MIPAALAAWELGMAAVVRNRFYSLIALALALVVVVGFTRTFYARGFFDLPPLPAPLQIHGFVFSAWVALFVVQTRFIAAHRIDLHRKTGIAGVVLAALMVAVGVVTAVASASSPEMRPMGFTAERFTIFPLTAITLFGIFVAFALIYRRRPALHKRYMLLGMFSILGPAIARILMLFAATDYLAPVQVGVTSGCVIWALVNDWLKHRVVHPVYTIGGAIVVLSLPLRAWIATTDTWGAFGHWLAT